MKSIFSFTLILLSISNVFFTACTKTEKVRPNIIFILTDDQRWDALGYAGNSEIHTPEMDKLASTGVYFSNAMVTTPICAASRASIFTGLQERTHRFDFSTGLIDDKYMDSAYPKLMREAGYYTGFFGKFGVKYKGLDKLFDQYDEYDRGNFGDRRSYYYKTIGADTVHLTRFTGQQGLDFIASAPSDKPFCLELAFSAPHAADEAQDQYFWQETTDSLFRGMEMAPAKISEDKYFEALPEGIRNGFNRLRWTWRYDTPEKYQTSVKGYYRMIAGIDLEIAKIRAALEAKGIADNTVIMLMGDNGYFIGERQLAGKWLMYDNCLRVPMIIYDPRVKNHQNNAEMALNIDIPATILDLAGVAKPASWQGKSLLPIVEGKTKSLNRDTILVEHLWDFDPIPPSEAVRTNEWKYMRYINDKSIEELYNIANDPMEINNLALQRDQQNRLMEFREKCNQLSEHLSDSLSLGPEKLQFKENAFSWELSPACKSQKGYQILVASSAENLTNNVGNVYNSNHINSDALNNIAYDGEKLESGKSYYWKVRIWDQVNRVSRYSAVQKMTIQ